MANQSCNSNVPPSLRINTAHTDPNHPARDHSNTSQPFQIPRLYQPADTLYLQPIDESSYDKARTSHKVEIVKDMYDGQDPPKYKSHPSNSDLRQSSLSVASRQGRPCDSCGKQQSASRSNDRTSTSLGECHKCGKRRASSDHAAYAAVASQPRSVSEASATTLVDTSSPNSVESEPAISRSRCGRCGKAKRPLGPTLGTQPSIERKPLAAVPPARHVASQHIMYSGIDKPPSRMPSDMPRRKPVASRVTSIPVLNSAVDIDVMPPTAISERPSSSIFQLPPSVDKSPLLNGNSQSQSKSYKPGRSKSFVSIASSISRSLSGRRSRSKENSESRQPSPLPISSNDQGPVTLFSMITNALRGNEPRDYSRIDVDTEAETRPDSPFSFTDRNGDDSIQLKDMQEQDRADRWEEVEIRAPRSEPLRSNPFEDPLPLQRPEYLRARSDILGNRLQVPAIPDDDMILANPQRPTELVRFKSLRSGVQRAGSVAQRAGSVARSTSLKRLNSLKNAPQYWYRTDMSFEGAMVGFSETIQAGVHSN